MDAKPLFHSGVAPLRKRGFPFFLDDRMLAMAGRTAVIPRAARADPSNPIAAVKIPARGAARGGDRTESTTPERRSRDRGQSSAAALRRSVRPASVDRHGAVAVDIMGPGRRGNDKFNHQCPSCQTVRIYT